MKSSDSMTNDKVQASLRNYREQDMKFNLQRERLSQRLIRIKIKNKQPSILMLSSFKRTFYHVNSPASHKETPDNQKLERTQSFNLLKVFSFDKKEKTQQRGSEEHPSHQVVEAADHLPLLQVGLSIQRGGLDVAQAVGVAGAQQQHVGGEELVASQPDEVSHPHLLPVLLHIASLCSDRTIRGRTAGVSCP